MNLRTTLLLAASLLSAVCRAEAAAQCELDKVTDDTPAPLRGFGSAVALHGDHAVIGIDRDESQCVGCDSGAALFFERSSSGWVQGQRLTPANVAPGGRFGSKAALHGSTAVVMTDGLAAGFWNEQVFVYEYSAGSWAQTQELTIPLVNSGSGFGHAALVQDHTIFVSAPWEQVAQFTSNGKVLVFQKSAGTWALSQELTCPASAVDHANHFGKSIAVDGNRAIVGMPEFSNFELGTAYAYGLGPAGWVQTGPRLASLDSAPDDHFGELVALSGTTALIWSPGKPDIYVFEPSPGGWVQTGKLQTLDGAVFDDITLDFSGELALVGIASDAGTMGGADVGATYIFERVGGVLTQTGKFHASDASSDAHFGAALDLSDGTALIAAPGDSGGIGAVYSFAFERLRNYCTSSVNSTGAAALMGYQGSASVSANDLVLTAGPVPAGEPGLIYYGSRAIGAPFGIGTRCVGGAAGTVFRFPFVFASPAGEFVLPINYGIPPAVSGHSGALEPGVTRKFQAWFRDPQGPNPGYNLSDGLSVTFCP